MRRVILAVVFMLSVGEAVCQAMDLSIDTVVSRMAYQRYLYPQEKVHVTTNQGSYVAGDTIWFRAWVVDAASHSPVTISRYVYAELQSPFGTVDARVKVMERDGVYQGYVALAEDLPEGTYTLSSYTSFMESAGVDYFFRKPVQILSPYSGRSAIVAEFGEDGGDLLMTVGLTDQSGADITYGNLTVRTGAGSETDFGHGRGRKDIRLNRKDRESGVVLVKIDSYSKYIPLPSASDAVCVSFHPEGGYLVPGESCRIGIKAIDSCGRGLDVTGRITDTHGNEISRFSTAHRGMGETLIVPQAGETYTAEVSGQSYALPTVTDRAAVLRVDNSRKSTVNVTAVGNVSPGAVLVVQNRGRAIYSSEIYKSVPYRFPRRELGSGVLQFLLLDGEGRPLSERLAFVYPDSTAVHRVSASVVSDASGRHRLTFAVPSGLTEGQVALSVVDRSLGDQDESTGILEQMLLQSDLRGHIEDPGYYFRDKDRTTVSALDALMLTQGWSRYDLPATLRGDYSEPTSFLERGMEITGIVRSRWKGKPLQGAQVNVLGPKIGYAGAAVTGSDGRFTVSDVEWPEGVKFVVQALDKKGNNEHNFEIDGEHYPRISSILPSFPKRKESGLEPEDVDVAERMRRVSRINGRLNIALSEVSVDWRKQKKPEDIYEVLSSRTFRSEDIEKEHITTYEELLRKIAGIIVEGGLVYYRTQPVEIFVDGMRWDNLGSEESGSNQRINATTRAAMQVANGMSKSNLPLIQPSDPKMMSWQKKTTVNLNEFRHQYPFDVIKRIDIIQPSMSAVFTSSGNAVLNVITKDGGEIARSNNWQYKIVELLGYQPRKEFYNPKYDLISAEDELIGRSTLYWSPNISVQELGEQQLPLPSANVSVLIEGLTPYGQIVHKD